MVLGIALFVDPTFSQTEAEAEAVSLLTAVSQRMAGVDQTLLITLTQSDRRDSVRTRRFRLWVHYPQPTDTILKQTLVLTLQTDKAAGRKYWSWVMTDGRERKWIYLPGSGKLQEISGLGGAGRQDFDFSELEVTPEQIDLHIHEVLERQILEGREIILIKSMEQESDDRRLRLLRQRQPGYKLLWIDPRALLILKAEFYSSQGRLLKRFTIEKTEIHQELELATSIRVWDAGQKTETVISISDLVLGPISDQRLFQPKAD